MRSQSSYKIIKPVLILARLWPCRKFTFIGPFRGKRTRMSSFAHAVAKYSAWGKWGPFYSSSMSEENASKVPSRLPLTSLWNMVTPKLFQAFLLVPRRAMAMKGRTTALKDPKTPLWYTKPLNLEVQRTKREALLWELSVDKYKTKY